MNRKLLPVLLAFALIGASLPALPKVAVLDAVIPDGMDRSVVVPITDKIAEEIVNSRLYSVLDRANVEQVLKEKEFQVSGMVQDSDIKQAGKYLGADFVIVARVSLVEQTYFISAKMIDVESGAVFAQVSDQEEGKAAVLIKIAERVGKKLMGGVVEVAKVPEPEKTAEPQKEPEPTPERPVTEKPRPRSTIIVEAGLPLFAGEFTDAAAEWVDYNSAGTDYPITDIGVGLRASFYLLPFLYIGGSFEHARQLISDFSGNIYMVFSGSGLMANVGYGLAIRPGIQVYAGGKIGFVLLMMGDYWLYREGHTASGISFGLEVGAELIFLKIITLSARVDWVTMGFPGEAGNIDSTFFDFTGVSSSYYDSPYTYNRIGLNIGAGIALGGRKK